MSFHITHLSGESESDFSIDRFPELLDELSDTDDEHPDVSVTHESEWTLTCFRSGFVVLENLEEGDPVHMGPLDRQEVLDLMVVVAEGRIEDVRSAPWKEGYPRK